MARETTIYEMDLQQTVVVTVHASSQLPDATEITSCSVEALSHYDDSVCPGPEISVYAWIPVISGYLDTRVARPALSSEVTLPELDTRVTRPILSVDL